MNANHAQLSAISVCLKEKPLWAPFITLCSVLNHCSDPSSLPGQGGSGLYIPIVTIITGGKREESSLGPNVITIQQPLSHTFHT